VGYDDLGSSKLWQKPDGCHREPDLGAGYLRLLLNPGTAAALGRIDPSDCDEWFLVISWPIAAEGGRGPIDP